MDERGCELDQYSEASRLFNPCFYQDASVLDLIRRLEKDGSAFASAALSALLADKSAFSLAVRDLPRAEA